MVKKHLKALAALRTWPIDRRKHKFVIRPTPGPHRMELCLPLGIILRDILGYSTSKRETKKILQSKSVFINGKMVREDKFPVGLFDTIRIDDVNAFLRVTLNKKGKIDFIQVDKNETGIKVCKIIGKSVLKNAKLQLNLYDGRNIIVDKDNYKVGDSVLLSLPEGKIKTHIKLEKNSIVFLTGGKHIGTTGTVVGLNNNKIIYKGGNEDNIETLKRYAFAIGIGKPQITLEKEQKNSK